MKRSGPKPTKWTAIAQAWHTSPACICDWDGRFRRCGINPDWDDPGMIRDSMPALREAGESRRLAAPRWMLMRFAELPPSRPPATPPPDESIPTLNLSGRKMTYAEALDATQEHAAALQEMMREARNSGNPSRIAALTKEWAAAMEILRKSEKDAGDIMARQQATLDKDAVHKFLIEMHQAIRKRLKLDVTQCVVSWVQNNPGAPASEMTRAVEDAIEAATIKLNEVELV